MRERSKRICRLLTNQESRAAYIKAKLLVLVPSQIRTLRLKSENPPMPRQKDLARETGLHQSRISMFETPGVANMTLETLANVAAGLRVGVVVKFVPFHEMLRWENNYSQDSFDVNPRLEQDEEFISPAVAQDEYQIAASSSIGGNVAVSLTEGHETQAGHARRPPARELFAQGAAVGGA